MKKELLVNILLENDLLNDNLSWDIRSPKEATYKDNKYEISFVSEEKPESESGRYLLIFQLKDSSQNTFWKIEGFEDSYDETRLYFKSLHEVKAVEKTQLVYEPVKEND